MLRELANRSWVYAWVRTAPGRYRRNRPLAQALSQAHRGGDFEALWRVEGLGYAHTRAALKRDPQTAVFDGSQTGPTPDSLMLHAGMGLGIAEWLLMHQPVLPAATLLDRMRHLCQLSGRREFLPCAYESLGIVCRVFYSQRLGEIDEALARHWPGARNLFWHGVGRGHYFVPATLAPWRALDIAASSKEAPTPASRHNLVAGLAWAIAMVNMRHPQVMARIIAQQDPGLENQGFRHGVHTAFSIRLLTHPRARWLGAYCRYQPGSDMAHRWETWVANPARRAFVSPLPLAQVAAAFCCPS